MKVAAYLYFKDNAEEVIETYKPIFGAEVVCVHRYNEDMTGSQELLGRIFHAELRIGDLNLYVCDSGRDASFPSTKFVVEIREENEARECFENILQKGRAISDFRKMPYGPTIAHAEDKFGIEWDIVIC